MVFQVYKAHPASQDHQVLLPQVLQETLAFQEKEDRKEIKVLQEYLYQAHLVKAAVLDFPDLQDHLDHQGLQILLLEVYVCQEHRAVQAPKAIQVFLAKEDKKVTREIHVSTV